VTAVIGVRGLVGLGEIALGILLCVYGALVHDGLTEYRGLVLGLPLVAVVFVFPGIAGTATRLASGWSRPARA